MASMDIIQPNINIKKKFEKSNSKENPIETELIIVIISSEVSMVTSVKD